MSGTITKSGGSPVVNCSLIKGQFAPRQETVRTWRVAGHDGKSAQQVGSDSRPVKIKTFLYDTKANYVIWRDALFALGGQIVEIQNSDGFTSGNVLITDIGNPIVKPGLPTYEIKAEIELTIETC